MRTAMRPRYYCDHCNKGNGSPSAMRRHEKGCTANPNRVCGMCAKLNEAGGPEPAPSRDALVKILDADGFAAMCKAANDCPACILSAPRLAGPGGIVAWRARCLYTVSVQYGYNHILSTC